MARLCARPSENGRLWWRVRDMGRPPHGWWRALGKGNRRGATLLSLLAPIRPLHLLQQATGMVRAGYSPTPRSVRRNMILTIRDCFPCVAISFATFCLAKVVSPKHRIGRNILFQVLTPYLIQLSTMSDSAAPRSAWRFPWLRRSTLHRLYPKPANILRRPSPHCAARTQRSIFPSAISPARASPAPSASSPPPAAISTRCWRSPSRGRCGCIFAICVSNSAASPSPSSFVSPRSRRRPPRGPKTPRASSKQQGKNSPPRQNSSRTAATTDATPSATSLPRSSKARGSSGICRSESERKPIPRVVALATRGLDLFDGAGASSRATTGTRATKIRNLKGPEAEMQSRGARSLDGNHDDEPPLCL